MVMVEKSCVFGFYEVEPEIMKELEGKNLMFLINEISAITSIEYDDADEKISMVLKPNSEKSFSRAKNLIGLLFNLLGVADSVDIEDCFAWREHDHTEKGAG